MRINVHHLTTYTYDPPANGAIQVLRLTPGNHDGQYVVAWRIEVSESCRLRAHEDAFGNITHSFTVEGPISELRVLVEGEVETQDTAGVVRGVKERFPPAFFLRETDLTHADASLRRFAEQSVDSTEGRLARLHTLMDAISEVMEYESDPTIASTVAAEAFKAASGVASDFAHVFIACARHLRIPARYVSGYLVGDGADAEARAGHQAGHAWAEAYVEDLGWVGFDAALGQSPTASYVRIASGLDYLGAAPVRGNRYGGGDESLTVALKVDQSSRQIQG